MPVRLRGHRENLLVTLLFSPPLRPSVSPFNQGQRLRTRVWTCWPHLPGCLPQESRTISDRLQLTPRRSVLKGFAVNTVLPHAADRTQTTSPIDAEDTWIGSTSRRIAHASWVVRRSDSLPPPFPFVERVEMVLQVEEALPSAFFGGHIQGKELVVLSDPGWNPAACQMDDRVFGFWHSMPYFHWIAFPSFSEETAMGSPCNCDYSVPASGGPRSAVVRSSSCVAWALHRPVDSEDSPPWVGRLSWSQCLCYQCGCWLPGASAQRRRPILHITHRRSIQHMGATFPTVVTHFTICEYLSRSISWDSLVQDYVFLLNGKQVGTEPLRVREWFVSVVLPSSQSSDRLCLASLCLPWWHWRVTLHELVLLTVGVHWPHGWPLRGGTTILFQVSPSEWFDKVSKLCMTMHGRQWCRKLAPVHRSFSGHQPMHSAGSQPTLVVHDSRKTDVVVILVRLLCCVGAKLLAIEVVSTAQLLLTILPAAPKWIAAYAIRVFLNGQPLEWQEQMATS